MNLLLISLQLSVFFQIGFSLRKCCPVDQKLDAKFDCVESKPKITGLPLLQDMVTHNGKPENCSTYEMIEISSNMIDQDSEQLSVEKFSRQFEVEEYCVDILGTGFISVTNKKLLVFLNKSSFDRHKFFNRFRK